MVSPGPARRFGWWLAGIVLVGLAIRLGWILLSRQNLTFGGDAGFYHLGANLLADGKGFVSPYRPGRQAADHPPLYLVWLALPSFVGLRSQLTHLIWSAVLGCGSIVLVGATARRIAGARAGLVAAGIAALYPNMWVPDGSLMAETMAIFTTALALYWSYRYWEAPSWRRLALVGVAAGAGALSRSELVLLVPLLVVPLAVLAPAVSRQDRWRAVLAGLLAACLVMAPWVGYNLTRFEKPELLSTQFGLGLSSTDCNRVWNAPFKSYFDIRCSLRVEKTLPPGLDASEQDARHRAAGLKYIRSHLHRLPEVLVARVGAVLGLYHPSTQIGIDGRFENRGMAQARWGMYSFYALAVLSIVGAIVLRRRRIWPVFPLLVPPFVVLVTVVTLYASTRFRASAEVSLCLLAAIALDAGIAAVVARRRGAVAGGDQPTVICEVAGPSVGCASSPIVHTS